MAANMTPLRLRNTFSWDLRDIWTSGRWDYLAGKVSLTPGSQFQVRGSVGLRPNTSPLAGLPLLALYPPDLEKEDSVRRFHMLISGVAWNPE